MARNARFEKLVDKALDSKVIKKLGYFVGLDLKYFVMGFSYLTFAQIIGLVLSLLFSVVLARLVSKEIFGQYNYIFSLIGIASVFTMPGMSMAITQAVANGHDRVLITATKEMFKWSIFGSTVLIGAGIYYFLSGSILLGKCVMISSLFFPFFVNFEVYKSFLTGKKSFGKLAKYQVMIQILSVLTTLLVVYFTRNLIPIIIAILASNSLLRGYFFRATLKKIEGQSYEPGAIPFGRHMTVLRGFFSSKEKILSLNACCRHCCRNFNLSMSVYYSLFVLTKICRCCSLCSNSINPTDFCHTR